MQLSYGNKKILQIAIPSIVSNITVPLLGLIDVTIVGHLGSAANIGAIAVGGMLFNIIYWIFGFLRMGTSGIYNQVTLSTSDHPTFKKVLVHEFGHGYAGLGDEYSYFYHLCDPYFLRDRGGT